MVERKVDVEFSGWEIKAEQRGYLVNALISVLEARGQKYPGNLQEALNVLGFSGMPTLEGGFIIEKYFSDEISNGWMSALLAVSKYMPKGMQVKVTDKKTSNKFLITFDVNKVIPKKIV